MLTLGEKSITKLFLGDKAISKAYLGDKLVFQSKNYTEVEYLETTAQQTNSANTNDAAWIDTGIIPNNNTSMECRMQFTTLISSSQGTEALNGATSGGRFAWGFANVSPRTNFYMGLGAQNLNTTVARDTNVHTFKIDAVNQTWAIDNSTGTFSSVGSFTGTNSIYLFARHSGSNTYANKPVNAKIWYCKIWDGDTLIRDFIPVLDKDNVPCMYDKVEDKFYYNAGTGEFLYG